MESLVKNFKKAARIVVVICLFVLAAFEIVALVSEIGGGFFPSFVRILKTFLMLLMYLVPAILLAVKKDKEGFVVLSFLLGYLVIAKTLSFLSYVFVDTRRTPSIQHKYRSSSITAFHALAVNEV